MILDIDTHDVDASLDNLIALLSPQGATAFLGAEIGPYLAKRAGERFQDEGDDVVGPWAPLRPATQAIRAEGPWPVAGDHPINRRTGELEDWVVRGGWNAYPSGMGAALQFPGTLPSGELKKKVQTAQQGDPASRTVARPVLGVNEADMLFAVTAYAFAVEAAIV